MKDMNVQTRLVGNKREELGKKLPLQQPYVLLVDPCNLCNLRCRWCPGGYDALINDSNRNQKVMDFSLFKKMIDQLSEFNEPIRVLRMYKEGEPLLNPHFAQMVSYAKKSGYISRIDTTTNGVLLKPELNRKIVSAGLDQINISVNGVSEEQIFRNTGKKINFDEYVAGIRDLYNNRGDCTVYVKSIKDVLSKEEQEKFFDVFGDISDRIFLERLSPAWPCFEFDECGYMYEEVGNYEQDVENRQVCPYLFYIMVVNSDGTVSTCVGDWKHHQLVGNIAENTVKEIWLGEKQREYQLGHLHGNKKGMEMCEKCLVISHGAYDNIDKYAAEIACKMIIRNK